MDLKECLIELKKIRKKMFGLQMKKINGEKGVITEQKKLGAQVRRISKRVKSNLELQASDKNTSLSTLYSQNLEVLSKLRSKVQDRIRNESKLHLSASIQGGDTLFSRNDPSVLDNMSKRLVHQNPEIIEAVKEKILFEEKKYSEILGLFEILKREVLFLLDTRFKKDLRTLNERELIKLYTQEIQNLKHQRANVFKRKEGKLVLFDRKNVIDKYNQYLLYEDEKKEMNEDMIESLIGPKSQTQEPRLFEHSEILPRKNRTKLNNQFFKNDKTVLKEILNDLEHLTKPAHEAVTKVKRLDISRKRASRRSRSRVKKKKQTERVEVKKKKKIKKSLTKLKQQQNTIIKNHTDRLIVRDYLEDSFGEEEVDEVKEEMEKEKQKAVIDARKLAMERVKESERSKKKSEKSQAFQKLKKERNKWKKRDSRIKRFLIRKDLYKKKRKKKTNKGKGSKILMGKKK